MPDPQGDPTDLPEQRPPTHTLTIAVPLNLEANPAAEHWDIQGALTEAMKAIMPMVRLGTLGLLCGDTVVTVEEVDA
jgi:hypothetical protein